LFAGLDEARERADDEAGDEESDHGRWLTCSFASANGPMRVRDTRFGEAWPSLASCCGSSGVALISAGTGIDMSNEDKMSNKIDELAGKGKEAAGRATDNPDLEAEGKGDQTKSNLKQAGEKVKDVFK
jgi:uncharacterized protein YjbJ (UPF0337 family)